MEDPKSWRKCECSPAPPPAIVYMKGKQMSDDYVSSPFDAIRHYDKNGNEYWSARDLCKLLGYSTWQKFQSAIEQAKMACENSRQATLDHFNLQVNLITAGKGAKKPKEDYHLTRYACYLVALNADPTKEIVAQAKTYFAIQTRRQELADEEASLETEEGKRIKHCGKMRFLDNELKGEAHKAGARNPRDFSDFFDSGYRGLYDGETENDIHARKGLQPKEKILDYMGSEELADNIFRAAQADAKLKREKPQIKKQANDTHYEVGRQVRDTIKRLGGTMPEHLPKPEKSVDQLEKEQKREIQKFLQRREQPQLPAFENKH